MVAIWACIVMVALVGFVSYGVDLGRVYVAKAELSHAAEAAARAGVTGLAVSPTEARNRAIAMAAANTCDGSPVVLTTDDIELGEWDDDLQTFTVLTGADQASANAMRVTARRLASRGTGVPLVWGQILGKPTCDVHASATVMRVAGMTGIGLAALSQMKMENRTAINSWSSASGAYSAALASDAAECASNADIELTGTARVGGDAHPGVGKTVKLGKTAVVTGDKTALTGKLSYPNVSAGTYATVNDNARLPVPPFNAGNKEFKMSSGSATIPAGTYYITKFEITGTAQLTTSGAATIYVKDSIKFNDNCVVSAHQNRPGNLAIKFIGNADVTCYKNSSVYADLYANRSIFYFENNAQFHGRIICNKFLAKDDAFFHHDKSLTDLPSAILTVR